MALASLALLHASRAHAQALAESAHTDNAGASLGFHADVEVDPTAYALQGYSLHVGVGHRRWRVDLGAFAMALPRVVHGNPGFDARFDGFGAKVQYFVWAEQRGLFVGADVGLSRLSVERRRSDLAAAEHQVSAGINAGYRFVLPRDFYVTTWLGVGYAFGADDVSLGGRTFEAQTLIIFPAVHLGYRFL